MNTNANEDLSSPLRIEALARRHGMERSLYFGEAIGNSLLIAWTALGSLGDLLRRAPPKGQARPG